MKWKINIKIRLPNFQTDEDKRTDKNFEKNHWYQLECNASINPFIFISKTKWTNERDLHPSMRMSTVLIGYTEQQLIKSMLLHENLAVHYPFFAVPPFINWEQLLEIDLRRHHHLLFFYSLRKKAAHISNVRNMPVPFRNFFNQFETAHISAIPSVIVEKTNFTMVNGKWLTVNGPFE